MTRWLCGEALVHVAVATAAAGLAVVAARAMGRTAPAALRHAVWSMAAVQFLLPFALLARLGEALGRQMPAIVPLASAGDFSMLARYGATGAAPEPGSAVWPGLLAVWGAGALLCGAFSLRQILATSRIRLRPPNGRETAAIRRAAERLGLRGPVRAGVTAAAGTPAAAGILRPVLLLPVGLSARLGEAELESVLMHELAHVRRRDNLTGAAVRLAACLFWFHPLIWWLERKALREREFAAYEMAVSRGMGAARYAAAILEACRLCIEGPSAGAAAVSGSDLKKRMERIMSNEWANRVSGRARAMVLSLAALIVCTPVLAGLWTGMTASAQTLEAREGIEFVKAEVLPAIAGAPAGHSESMAALAALFSPYTPSTPAQLGVTWGKWLAEDVAYIITPEERREFLSLSSDAQREDFAVRFWQRRGRAAKVEHYRRIEYANRRFRSSAVPGWRTDRGRLYIVMGPPDEVEVHRSPHAESWFYRSFDGGPDGLQVTFHPLP